jgi:iron complex transport system substrate-binding protein
MTSRLSAFACLGVLAASIFCGSSPLADAPKRVASFNLCADQLVVALADPGQIAGLSPYAADPVLSVVAEKARGYPRLDWQAESTIALQPDLVLVGPNDRSATRRFLAAQALRVEEVELITDFAAAQAQVLRFGALLGHPDRAQRLNARLEAARARLRSLARPPFSTALVVERGGYTQGRQSLAASLLGEAGLRPPAGSGAGGPGAEGYGGFVSLERLLMLRPDVLFLKDPPVEPTDQGALFFTHPAVRSLYPPERRIALPTRLTLCGGPALVAALDYLADVMTRLATPSQSRPERPGHR